MAISNCMRTVSPFKKRKWSTCGSAIFHQRTFHVTSPSRILDESFAITHSILTSFHTATGTPWVSTLPLAALIVRSFIIGPLSIYSQIIGQRRMALQPLQHAWVHLVRRKIFEKYAALGPIECNKLSKTEIAIKVAEIHERHGTQVWKGLVPYLQIPVFLIIIETLRKMCGTHAGLLGLLARSSTVPDDKVESITSDQIEHVSIPVEQSFTIEGALWFPNLLVPDPMFVLPFILSGSLLANIFYHSRQAKSSNIWQRRINNTFKIMALAIGPLTLQVPSAMLVYWISSSAFALGHSMFLHKLIPRRSPVSPCKPQQERQMIGINES